MKLYQRKNGYWYIRFRRGVERSTGTRDEAEAQSVVDEISRTQAKAHLARLEQKNVLTLDRYREMYVAGRDDDMDADTTRADDLALRSLMDVIGANIPLNLVDEDALKRFRMACLRRGLKKTSVNTYLRHIKSALRHAVETGHLKEAPRVGFIKVGKRLPVIIPPDHFPFILDSAYTLNYEMWRIIRFAMWTGCRREEILNVRHEHRYNHAGGTWLNVYGKGDWQRSIFLLDDAVVAMEPLSAAGRVFHPFHKDTVSKQFKAIVRACGYGNYKFHNLRHSAGTQMLACKIPLPVIQRVLGHSDIATTQIYAHVLDDVVADQMQRFRY